MSRHDRLIERAIDVARTSTYRWMVGAVVTHGPRVLGVSPNKFRNPPWINHLHATRHAEVAALSRVRGGDTIYVARVNPFGQPRLARPCDGCHSTLTAWGVRYMVFTNNDGGYTVERVAA